jgi:hypothetical protein
MPKVNDLLREFENAACRSGNGYADEKIGDVRSNFDECPVEHARRNVQITRASPADSEVCQ